MAKAVFPGSFDPVTVGHLDLINRASELFDEIIVGVLINSSKTPMFTIEERVDMLQRVLMQKENVTVTSFDGLLVDFVTKVNADAIVRGLRTAADFDYELPLAQANYKLNNKADTIFLATSPEYSYISSSGVKEILRYGGEISGMVPEELLQEIIVRGN